MNIIIRFISFLALLSCMLMGIFAAAGFCAFIFGSQILDTALGDTPNRTHPVFITFMLLMVPGIERSLLYLFRYIKNLEFHLARVMKQHEFGYLDTRLSS